MKHPCEAIGRHVLPAFRSLIARGLIHDYGFTQTTAAKKLGTTQAAISYYLTSKRGEKYVETLEKDQHVKSQIDEIVKGLGEETLSSEEVMEKLCGLCMSFRNSDLLDITP